MSDAAAPSFRDASFQVRFAGVVFLGFGLLFLLFAVLYVVMAAVGQMAEAGLPMWMVAAMVGFYGLLGAAFLTLGGGLLARRRWARALSSAISGIWLAYGIVSLVAFGGMGLAERLGAPPLFGPGMGFLFLIALGFVALFFIVLPGGLVLALASTSARATCAEHDSRARWTDGIPDALLGLAAFQAVTALSCLLMMIYPALPICDRLVGQPMIAIGGVVFAAIWVALAIGTLRRRVAAWWGQLVVGIVMPALGIVSMGMTSEETWERFYTEFDLGVPQQDLSTVLELYGNPAFLATMGVVAVLFVLFLLAVRPKYRSDDA